VSVFDYVRNYYGMPWVGRGVRVLALGKPGVITNASHYINVRLDGQKHANPYHPDDVKQEPSGERR
jgi:hypothetical protein